MNTKKSSLLKILGPVSAVLVAIACGLSIYSSRLAYALSDLNTVILSAAAAIVLILAAVVLNGKFKSSVVGDILLFGSLLLAVYAFSRVLMGRLNLMGYIWFSDLEKGNPAAIRALNLSVGAWVCYLLAAVLLIILGFRKTSAE